jgi:O-antigen/teichoic acid export membrane protein
VPGRTARALVTAPSYGTAAGRGVVASLGNQAYRIVLQVASVVVLARLLDPEDFGLVAMVLAVVGVGELFRDLGLSGAAIQVRVLTPAQRDNLFWLNTGMGAAVTAVVALCAPLVAAAYRRPELVGITLALAPSFLLSGLATQHRVGLVRELRFRRIAVIDAVSVTVALAVGVTMAAAGAGYWALVGQQLASGLVTLPLLFAADRWVPGRWRAGQGTRRFVSFGGHLLLSSVAVYASTNADTFVVGRWFGADVLGFYNRGAQLVRQPARQVSGAFVTVMQPILARIHDERERFETALRHGQLASAYPLAIAGAVLVADPGGVVRLTMGPSWSPVVPFLVVMVVGVVARQVTMSVAAALTASGLGRALSRYVLVSSLLTIGFIVAGATQGPVGAAWGWAGAPVLTWTVGFAWLRRHTGLPVTGLRLDGLRVLLVGVAGALVGRLTADALSGMHELPRLLVVTAAVLATVALATLVPPVRRDALVVVGYLSRVVGATGREAPADPASRARDGDDSTDAGG